MNNPGSTTEHALANRVEHPLNVNLREDAIIGRVGRWLAREFAPHRLGHTIRRLVAVQVTESATHADEHEEVARKIAEYDCKLAQYRAALDAEANAVPVAAWIAETEAEKAGYELAARLTGADKTIRWSTAAAVVGVADYLSGGS